MKYHRYRKVDHHRHPHHNPVLLRLLLHRKGRHFLEEFLFLLNPVILS